MRVADPLAWQRARKCDLAAILALANDLSCGGLRGRVSFCNGQANILALDTSTLLLPEDDFQVAWLRDVEEVLWVTAPELVLTSLLVNSLATSCLFIPFG